MTDPAAALDTNPTQIDRPGASRDGERNRAFLDVLDQKTGGPVSTAVDAKSASGNSRASEAQGSRSRSGRATDALNPTSMARTELVSPAPLTPTSAAAQQDMLKPASQSGTGPAQEQPKDSEESEAKGPARGAAAPSAGPATAPKANPSSATANASVAATDPAGAEPSPVSRDGQKFSQAASIPTSGASALGAGSVNPQSQTVAGASGADEPAERSISGVSPSANQGAGARPLDVEPRAGRAKVRLPEQPLSRFTLHAEDKLGAQAARGLAAALRQGGGSVTLRLHPEELGDLKVRVDSADGRIGATFEVQSEQARDLLDKTLSDLRTALEARGLSVDRLDVHIAPSAHGHAGHGETGTSGHFGGAESRGGAGWEAGGRGGGERWAGQDRPASGGTGMTLGMERTPPTPFADSGAALHGAPSAGPGSLIMQPGGVPLMRVRLDAVA